MAVVGVVVAVAVLSVVSLAGAASGGRQGAVAVGAVHDVTPVDHHWTTLKLPRR